VNGLRDGLDTGLNPTALAATGASDLR